MDKHNEIEQLVESLNKYAREYYTEDNPTVSDKEYDMLYDKLKSLEKETGYVLKYSPTQRVGDDILEGFSKHRHKERLWSLDKGQNIEEISAFHNRNLKAILEYNENNPDDKLPELRYVVTKKFDGLTINLTYDDEGILVKGASRGTGEVGEDITNQVKTIKSIPLKIDNDKTFELHGEAIMTREAFEEYNKNAKIPLKNLRNGAAGAIRNLNIKETARRNLSAFFYDIGYNEGIRFESYVGMLEFIKNRGFVVDDYIRVCSTMDEVEESIKEIEDMRSSLNYDIDGAVIAVDDMKTREVLGYTIKFPKWSIAYKFEAEETSTKLLNVEWNVGRSGRVGPTAILEPVELGGVTVKRATLNNMDDIRRKGIKIGASVYVRRSNDVIPEIMGIAKEGEDTSSIVPPKNCPSCGSELILDGAHYFCENTMSCKPQMVKSIVHFASREAMNITGFSEKTAQQLYEELDIKAIPELYNLKKEDLVTLEKFGDKKAQNLLNSIESSKKCDLASFIYALGIPSVGKKTAKDLCKKFKNLNNIKNADFDSLISVEDIGEIVAKNIIEFFKNENINDSIERLLYYGISISYEETAVETDNVFKDKTIVVTGTLKDYSRKEIKEKLESLGAKMSGSVSKKTDYLLYGEESGSKYDKAISLGIKTIDEEEFKSLLK